MALASVSAQQFVDVTDPIYVSIDEWERAGFVDMVPDIRPFPRRVLIPILERVVRVAPAAEAARAQEYLDLIGGTGLRQAGAGTSVRGAADSARTNTGATLNFAFEHAGLDGLWDFSGYVLDEDYRTTVPAYVSGAIDTFEDSADLTVRGRPFLLRQSSRFNTSVGTYRNDGRDFYGQAGIMRSAWGPFPTDNAVLGGEAIHHPSFAWYWAGESLSFSWLYNEITATNYLDTGIAGGKHFMFHSLRWRPFSWIDLSYIESVTWGPEWDLRYFLPFHSFFYTQSFSDFGENTMIGLAGTIRLPERVTLDGTLYVDDADFNDLIRFNFAEAKLKASFQAGVAWSPLMPWLRSVRAEYLAVTPYMYTHQDERTAWMDDPEIGGGVADDGDFDPTNAGYQRLLETEGNFQNYTHYGDNLGPVLLPNSDRIALTVSMAPTPMVDIHLVGRMIRHGNASEGQDIDETLANGDLLDDGYDNMDDQTFADETRFLTQETIERVLQGTVEARVTLPVPGMPRSTVALGGGYTLEHVANPGLVAGTEETNQYWLGEIEYRVSY